MLPAGRGDRTLRWPRLPMAGRGLTGGGMARPSLFFTPTEANALLPSVRKILERATTQFRRHNHLMHALRNGQVVPGKRAAVLREVERLRGEINDDLESLQDLGIEIKGLQEGLIDFPALRNGEEVCLCWRLGEERVGWWHPLTTGVQGRQVLNPEDGSWEIWN